VDSNPWVPPIVSFGSAGDDPAPPTENRTSERSDFLPASSGLPLTDPLSPDLLVSLSDSQHLSPIHSLSLVSQSLASLSLTRSLVSVSLSLAVSVFGQQNREETKKEERRIKEIREEKK
jgi:hypothetical protein